MTARRINREFGKIKDDSRLRVKLKFGCLSVHEENMSYLARKENYPESVRIIFSTYQLVESFEIVRDDLRLRPVYEAGLLLLVLVVALLVAGAVHRLILGGDLAVNLPFHLHQQRREHAELGAATRHLQQAQYDMSFVFTHYQVLGLEKQALDDAEAVAAPVDEVRDVVAGEEGAGLRVRQVGHIAYLAHRQRQRSYRTCHRHFAGLTTGHVVRRIFPHVVGMLETKKNHF